MYEFSTITTINTPHNLSHALGWMLLFLAILVQRYGTQINLVICKLLSLIRKLAISELST